MVRISASRLISAIRGERETRRGGPIAAGFERAALSSVAVAYPWRRLLIGVAAVLATAMAAAAVGSVDIPPLTLLSILASRIPIVSITPDWPDAWETILWDLRLPRITLAGMVGAALALSGATYQGLFRNPLADPYLIGVASSAGLGAIIVLVTGVPHSSHGVSLLPGAAFIGAIGAVTVAYLIARSSEGLPLTTLILAGVAIAYLTNAMGSLLLIRSESDLRPVLSWLLGGFISAQWKHTVMVLPYLVPSLLVVFSYGRVLNVLQLDEEHSQQLGVNVELTKLLLIVAASLATAAAVAFSGPIGFVGLIAPHAVRLIWGVDYRALLPMAAIVGAGFLILADTVARTLLSPIELPVGVITAFCGAPFFLYLLRQRRTVAM